MSQDPNLAQFADNLERFTKQHSDIGLVKVYLDGALIRAIAHIPGQSGSLRVLSTVQNNGAIDKGCALKALEIFNPLINHAKENPGKHPTIDLLLGLSDNQKLTLEFVKTPDNLFKKLSDGNASAEEKHSAVMLLDQGLVRCAEKLTNYSLEPSGVTLQNDTTWTPQTYAAACLNAAFSAYPMKRMGEHFYDKVPLKTENWSDSDFERAGVRFIPGSFVRRGAYLGAGTVVMPGGIVNVGAYVAGSGVMIDGGARVATGAQIGKGVKLGAGSGIEGILEPPGRLPSIIEDNVKIGANCELMGIVEQDAVVASGVVMASGKKIYDLRTNAFIEPRYMSLGESIFEIPVIPKNRVAVGGIYNKSSNIGIDCIVLLEKDASDTSLAQMPKNSRLYLAGA
jgi:2,3,4,5-tetrahydropyridine-2,6-dicarboxylate N-succinyltransferase